MSNQSLLEEIIEGIISTQKKQTETIVSLTNTLKKIIKEVDEIKVKLPVKK